MTWSAPERTPMYGYPGQLLVPADGRLLCTYGRREAPFGVRADLPNGDLGYPTTIEYAPGRLFCCYYGQEPDGVTCARGTYVNLSA
jgi:hypothetical protein